MSNAIQVADDAADRPVSVVVTRRIKPGCERAYEELVKGIHEAIKGFDGYLGSHILRPSSPEHPEYRIIFRFDTAQHLRAWEVSAERREWLERMSGMIVGAPVYQALSGLETWFTLPGGGPIVPPPRYKMMLVTWLAVFPLLTGLQLCVPAGFPGHADLAARAGRNHARGSADDVPGDAAHDTAVQGLALSRGDVVIGKGGGHSNEQGDVAGRPRPISRQAEL